MDFELSEEQTALREVSRALLAEHCPSAAVRAASAEELDVPKELWELGAEMGWTGLLAPTSAGGTGMGVVELVLVAEELGRAVAPGPFLATALAAWVSPDSALTQELAEGRLRAALVAQGALTIAQGPEGLVLSGRGGPVQAAADADWLLVAADPHLMLVPADQAVLSRRHTLDETRRWFEVRFESVPVPEANVISSDTADVRRLLDTAAVLAAADALGAGRRILEMTIDHVRTRHQFGVPLGSFQVVKHKVVDMLLQLEGLQAATAYAAMALDARTQDASSAASVAKAYASEVVPAIAGEALQTHGGIGFTWEHDLHLYLRRVKADALVLGDAAFHHDRVAAVYA